MRSAMVRAILAAAVVCSTAALSQAQTTATSTETKAFEVIAVDGNDLTVKLPEGTRDIAVPAGFMFTVNGKQLSVSELGQYERLSPTSPPNDGDTVTVTGSRTVPLRCDGHVDHRPHDEGIKSFTQAISTSGVKIVRTARSRRCRTSAGRQAERVIIAHAPPKVVTKEVEALASAGGRRERVAPAAAGSGSASATRSASGSWVAQVAVAPGRCRRRPWPLLTGQRLSWRWALP